MDRFLSTPELVLCVVNHLEPYDLLAVSRVNGYLKAVIKQSKALASRLASGPSKHFTDLPANAWNLDTIGLNTRDFPKWSCGYFFPNRMATMRLSESREPLISMQILDPGPLISASRPEEHVRLRFDWTPDTRARSMIFDPVHNQYLPTDRSIRKVVTDNAYSYPTDPPLPTTVSVARVVVSSLPAPHRVATAPRAQYSSDYASVEAKVGPCTFGDMIKVVRVLSRTSPRGWTSTTNVLEWLPHTDYPNLVSDVELKEVISMIQVWPVLYNKIY